MTKRYVLYECDADLDERDIRELGRILEGRHGKLKLIAVSANHRVVIVKASGGAADELRRTSNRIRVREKVLSTALTSGAIGKLKRRAAGSRTRAVGEISQ